MIDLITPGPPRAQPVDLQRGAGVTAQVGEGMTLRDFIPRYLASRSVCSRYGGELLTAVSRLERFAKCRITIEDLSRDLLNAFVDWYRPQVAAETARSKRRMLLTLWNAAHDEGLHPDAPRKIKSVKCPERIIEGWDAQQAAQLIGVARELPGTFRRMKKIRRGPYMESMFRAAWDTGLRLGDVQQLAYRDIWPDGKGGGFLSMVQSKTQKSHRVYFRHETLMAINETIMDEPDRYLIWPAFAMRRRFYLLIQKLVKQAGLSGTFRYLRRGSASEVEKIQPGCGWKHLGHRRPGLFETNYAVARICDPAPVLPPAVG